MIPCRKCRPGTMGRQSHCSRSSAKHQKPRRTPRSAHGGCHVGACIAGGGSFTCKHIVNRNTIRPAMKDGSNRRRLAVVPAVGTCNVLLAAHTRTAAKSPRGPRFSPIRTSKVPRHPCSAKHEGPSRRRRTPGSERTRIQLEADSAADVRGFLASYPDGPNALNAKPRVARLTPSKSDGSLLQISPGGPSSAGSSC